VEGIQRFSGSVTAAPIFGVPRLGSLTIDRRFAVFGLFAIVVAMLYAAGLVDVHALGVFGVGAMTYPVGGPGVPQANANEPGSMIPFTRATTYRAQQQDTTGPQAMTTSQQNVEITMQGSGYAYGADIDVTITTAANAAAVAWNEDAPWNSLASIVFKDVQGELVNLDGFSLRLANLYCGYITNREDTPSTATTAVATAGVTGTLDTGIYQQIGTAVGTGGSARFHLWLPIATNRRDLIGVLGNQDRAMRYQLRTDIAASGSVYTTPPTTLGNVTIRRTYHSLTVPDEKNGNGATQERQPPKFGILHYTTKNRNVGIPAGGSTVNHPLARLGNTIRVMILVFRSNGSRATAEANIPTLVTFKLGDIPIFSETPQARRRVMFNRYGFDAPAGVLVYDAISDFFTGAGAELGEDYWWTNGLVNAQFEITYPSGFGSTNNSLDVITDDLLVPAEIDFYAAA
jgi:hypothetical protein